MIHPDYQYDSRVIPHAVGFIELDICDVVLGSRIRSRDEALRGGMPVWKYLSNRVLTSVENIALGQNLGDFHSGFRVYRRAVLETIPFERNCDDFVFDTQFLVQAVHFGFRLGDVPVPVRYFDEASSINFRRSLRYGLSTLGVVGRYWLNRLGIVPSRLFQPRPPPGKFARAERDRNPGGPGHGRFDRDSRSGSARRTYGDAGRSSPRAERAPAAVVTWRAPLVRLGSPGLPTTW